VINKNSRIFLAGHTGLVGSAVFRILKENGYKKILIKSRQELDLKDQNKVFKFLKKTRPDGVIICAAKVGGINANNLYRGEFIYDNLSIQNNIIHGSFLSGVKNLIFLGSSCIYPKFSKQPLKEEYMLTGPLEFTNEPYAIAKIAGVKLCESYNRQYKTNYKCLMPSNIYGPNDNYNSASSHFFPAILKKMYLVKINNQKKLFFWGNGLPKRELTFVDDIAEACVFFLKKKTKETLINLGSGFELSIKDYVKKISQFMNLNATILFDKNHLMNGVPRKIVDCSIAKKYGWKARYSFAEGFAITYKDFLKNNKKYLKM
jgi:GDP-L-fucose synthase